MDSNTVVETKPVDPLDTPEVNQAAYNFQNAIKVIKMRTRTMSRKSMERVFDAVMEFPLAAKEPKFRDKIEHEVFILSLNALAAKTVMMDAVLKDQTETLNKLKEAEEATQNATEGENING